MYNLKLTPADIGLGQAKVSTGECHGVWCLRLDLLPPFTLDVWTHYHAIPRGIVVTKVAMGEVLLGGYLVSPVNLKMVVPLFI